MYTTEANLEHTIQLQEELFRQRLRLRGIQLNDQPELDQLSEHLYDNIDSEDSDVEEKTSNLNEQNKRRITPQKVRFSDQYYSIGRRKSMKTSSSSSTSRLHLFKSNPKYKQKTSFSSKLFTVNIA